MTAHFAADTITYGVHTTPLGALCIARTPKGVCRAAFVDTPAALTDVLASIRRAWPESSLHEDVAATAHMAAAAFSDAAPPLHLEGTAFQQAVWEALRQLPRGSQTTYAQLAADLGRPSAVRAVANAVAANPVALFVPCHRVVRTGGGLGGYRWGVQRKAALLQQEAGSN